VLGFALKNGNKMIRLICWNPELATARATMLQDAGFQVDASKLQTQALVSHFKAAPPEAVVIDLDRLPSHGREVATALRNSKSTRFIPIVFAGGVSDKVDGIRRELPDAIYTDWPGVVKAVKRAVKKPPANPIQPTPHMERYTGSPLTKKLGIKPGTKVAILGEPEGFSESLSDLPEAVNLTPRVNANTDLALVFVRSSRELDASIDQMTARLPDKAHLWIIHPKQASNRPVDFNQNHVRKAALASGWVDYKVCSVDANWSGLKFARRK
jgi:CheY-like chemotaxis protein